MLKKLFVIIFLFTLSAIGVCGQEEIKPVKWSLSVKNTSRSPSKGNLFNAVLKAEIQKGWHLYAMEKTEGGPIATRITVINESLFELGKIIAPKPLESEDSSFNATTKYYEDLVTFTLPIKVLQTFESVMNNLKIKVRFQSCNSEMCLAPRTVLIESNYEKVEENKQ